MYGMSYSLMSGYQSTSNATVVLDNVQNVNSPLHGSAPVGNNRGNQNRGALSHPVVPRLTNTSVVVLRQQMDDSNHELVNMLTNQMGDVFNPIVQEWTETNR